MNPAGMEEIRLASEAYPALLRRIAGPPDSLFRLGAAQPDDRPAVAIVGTRKATADGRACARKLAADLGRAGAVIVSGLAFGVDAAAHEGALRAGGRTIAVMARGLDAVYPAAHEGLAKRIIDAGGALYSEYPPGTDPLPYRFLERNRIVAGLAVATIIVEAPIHSGSLVTAKCALESGREVYIVPGPAGHSNYAGSHMLIRNGARLVASAADVLEDLEPLLPNYGLALPRPEAVPPEARNEADRAILAAIAGSSKPLTVDNLAELINLETHILSERLAYLILSGTVREDQGRYSLQPRQ